MADILVRGMEMPKSCSDCPMYTCMHNHADCHLVELPEHGDLIDRDAFREDMTAWLNWCSKMWITPTEIDVWEKLMETLDIAPAIVPSNKEVSEDA